jgi:hypothetical protein
MKDFEQNIFNWISQQLNTEINSCKGPIQSQRQIYNIKCIEIIAEAIKMFPNCTFKQILTNYGLFNDIDNTREESNVTLGNLRTYKKQYEHWDKLGFSDGLKGE